MPELPDLEVFKVNIYNRLTSRRLTGLEVFSRNKVTVPQTFLTDELKGRELAAIHRSGKELLFDFGEGRVISAHLMLNGQISIVDEGKVNTVKYKIFAFYFENEALIFSDRGRMCTIKYQPVTRRAPDVFDDAFTLKYFMKAAHRNPLINIKTFLLDQHIMKGIGNAYADEILWAARISPHSIIGKIPDDALATLHATISPVLKDAIASIKSISPDIISGEERSFLKVHNKDIRETETGHPIIVESIMSKTTYYTAEQIFYK